MVDVWEVRILEVLCWPSVFKMKLGIDQVFLFFWKISFIFVADYLFSWLTHYLRQNKKHDNNNTNYKQGCGVHFVKWGM